MTSIGSDVDQGGAVTGLSQHGKPVDAVMAELADKRRDDVRWEEGRAFGTIYNGGPSVHAVAEQATRLHLHENALNTYALPSRGAIEAEVVGQYGTIAAGLSANGIDEPLFAADELHAALHA
jgi:glutamate/tyrosine decarboxylase-like PLP-dependent enzyme